MGKSGKDKNTKNKAKHSRLMAQKKNKLKLEKASAISRKKDLIKKINEQQQNNE